MQHKKTKSIPNFPLGNKNNHKKAFEQNDKKTWMPSYNFMWNILLPKYSFLALWDRIPTVYT